MFLIGSPHVLEFGVYVGSDALAAVGYAVLWLVEGFTGGDFDFGSPF